MIAPDKTTLTLDALLAEVLEEYLEGVEAGTAPPRAELLARHPELTAQLEACLASLDFIRRAAPLPSSPPSGTPLPVAKLPAEVMGDRVHLGDYRILREIGRGGMGIVYEAEQPALSRHVALKVLPFAAALDPRQLQRFRTEAKAAALLRHPHIVPVLGVGSERDVHYYVMKYIDGHALTDVIRELRALRRGQKATDSAGSARELACSLVLGRWAEDQETGRDGNQVTGQPVDDEPYCRLVASLGIQAAQALEHAHEAGIIHRDIKPGNLLIDAGGHLWVTDFGLARFLHTDHNLTLTGDLIGTLRYMSPEQALGKHGFVDQRADIYSLGITLYELVTLEPAFRGNDRRELLRQIAEEEPLPPRRVNKAMPAALETILLKAIAKEPADRYATAQELAADLERFVANQPIAAKRPSLVIRSGRWARRHKSMLASVALVAILAVSGLVVSSILILRESKETERRARQARQAVDEMYTQVAQRWWYQQPYMEQVQRDFLLKALHFYEEFAQDNSPVPRWRLESAKAARRVGEIQHKLGEHAKAREAYDLAIARLTQLVAEFPGDSAQRDELANALNSDGSLLRENGRPADAERAYRQAHTLFADLAAEDPSSPAYRDGLAGTLGNLGMALHVLGKPADAEKAYEQALAVFVGLTKDYPSVPAYAHGLAGCRNNLANLLRDTGRPRAARLAYEQALSVWRQLSSDLPGMPIFRQAQAASFSGLGIVFAAQGQNGEAETAHRAALSLRERLAQEYPGVPAYRQALAASHHSLGRLLTAAGHVNEARAGFAQALTLRQKLAEDMPLVPSYRQELSDSHDGLAALLADAGQPRQAEHAQREAQRLRRQLVQESPDTPDAQWDLARGNRALGNILQWLGQNEEAEKLGWEAVTRLDKLATAFPLVPAFRLELAAGRGDLATLYRRTGRLALAEQLQRAVLALLETLAADFPESSYYRLELAYLLANCPDAKLRKPERAIALAAKVNTANPKDVEARTVLGIAQYRVGAWAEAVKLLEGAEESPGRYQGGSFVLAMAHWQLGNKEKAVGCYCKGSAWLEQHPRFDEDLRRLGAEARTTLGLEEPAPCQGLADCSRIDEVP